MVVAVERARARPTARPAAGVDRCCVVAVDSPARGFAIKVGWSSLEANKAGILFLVVEAEDVVRADVVVENPETWLLPNTRATPASKRLLDFVRADTMVL